MLFSPFCSQRRTHVHYYATKYYFLKLEKTKGLLLYHYATKYYFLNLNKTKC